jgi:hypothetical protein
MTELLPLDQAKAMKTAELNLAHIQLGENLALIANSPTVEFRLKLDTMNRAIDLASIPQDKRNELKLKFIGTAVNQTLSQHGALIESVETEALKSSQGNQQIYQKTMDAYYNSDAYNKYLEDLNGAYDIMLTIPALSQLAINAQQKMDAQGRQAYLESAKEQAKEMRGIIQTRSKMALQAGNSAVSFALNGGYDGKAVSETMAILSKEYNDPYVDNQTKMVIGQQVKQLVEAKKLGKKLQENFMSIKVADIQDPELAEKVLIAQERFKAEQIRLEEKQQKQLDSARQDYYNASMGMKDGTVSDSIKKTNPNWRQIAKENGALPFSKEELDQKVIEYADNLEGLAKLAGVQSGTTGETAFLASVGRLVGIEDQQTLHAMIQLADTRKQGLEYLKLNRVIQNLDDKFGEDKKKLLQGHIATYSKDKKNVLLFQSTHLLKPQVFTNLVIAKTITEIGEKGVFDKDGNPSLAFKTKFAENYTALGKQFVSNAKRIVNNNFAVQTAIRTNNYVPIYRPKNVYIEPADHTDWNHQPVPVSALVGKFSWYGEKTGAGTFKLTSAYRHIRTSKRTQHSGDVKGEFALDFADNGNDRQTQLQFFSIISGISDISKDVQMTGHGSMMYNYAKMAKSGKSLNYLTPQQNASLQKRLKKVKMLDDEGASAENHFHVRAIPIEESVLRAVPASTKARLTNR